MMNNSRRSALVLTLFFTASASAFATACNKEANGAALPADSTIATTSETQLMQQGVAASGAGNSARAIAAFRQVLFANPTHYGAHFQIAKAFDKAGQPDSARIWWTKFLPLAQASGDSQSVRIATVRLAAPDTISQEALMIAGVQQMYAQKDPMGAANQFREVLSRNPTHYGATYQLATALDRAGRAHDAHQVWITMLGMAESIHDSATITKARARLRN